MKKVLFALTVVSLLTVSAFAGNGAPNGNHYNLNIIGVDKSKTTDMTDSQRHTIFVPLNNKDGVATKIYLVQGQDFVVCDGNGFDEAWSCPDSSGNTTQVGTLTGGIGAVFQLPCNSGVETDFDCTGAKMDYSVWIRVLGKPGGSMTMKTCAYDQQYNMTYCNGGDLVISLTSLTGKNNRKFTDVTRQLTTLYASPDGGTTWYTYPLFNSTFEEWWWAYLNNGVRLTQLRFYPE